MATSEMKPLVCKYCRDPEDVTTCAWEVEVPVTIPHSKLTMDHQVVTYGQPGLLRPLTVQRFVSRAAPGRGPLNEPVTMYALKFTERDYYLFFRQGAHQGVQVLGRRPCANPCCRRHRCERGPNATYCMEHWRSWETAA